MEENNYRDDFELFLKESADEFKMVPSRRIWYSLYNNLHPDKKWPSMAVCLLILTAVLYLGIANNNSLSNAAKKASTQNFSNLLNQKNIDHNITFSEQDFINSSNNKATPFSITVGAKENSSTTSKNLSNKVDEDNETASTNSISTTPIPVDENNRAFNFIAEAPTKNVNKSETHITPALPHTYLSDATFESKVEDKNAPTIPSEIAEPTISAVTQPTDKEKQLQKIDLLNIEKSWKEDYAFRNKPAISKFIQNSTFSYYITPSFGYRTFAKTSEPVLNNSASFSPNTSASNSTSTSGQALLDNGSLNLEAGAVLQYSLSKNFRIKGGVQTNYTNYVSSVSALGHPSLTTITVNNNSNNIRYSDFSTKAGNERLNKTTMQIALPVGADYKIAGNGKLNWYVGGNIQPTYIIGGNAFVLSSDEKYYVSENALLRKLNLNTSIETFLSFKSSNGVMINFGPQARYQLLSTYKTSYGYKEKIYNVGLKIGITTSF